MDLGPQQLLEMYRNMAMIRYFDQRAVEEFHAGNIPGVVHAYIGEEAVAVGVCTALRRDDKIVSTHRGHGHTIAKGADIKRMMAELFGRSNGYCHGKGGSMHIADFRIGMLGANGIVGAGLPIATGAALAAQLEKGDRVAVAFFGDGASNEGAFHGSLNLASIWKLPVIFVCENNGYAEFTPLSAHTKVERLARHAKTYDIGAATVDGNDVIAVRSAVSDAVERCRKGHGPLFVECLTHRMRGHYEGDPAKYRELSQLAEWKKRDPIARLTRVLQRQRLVSAEELAAIEQEARARAEQAADFSLSSPWPSAREVAIQVTAD